MKITMYELLGLIKDGKAPEKIKYEHLIYELTTERDNYYYKNGMRWFTSEITSLEVLNNEVEIIEEPKKILKEALFELDANMPKDSLVAWQKANNGILKKKIDELIDEINKLKED